VTDLRLARLHQQQALEARFALRVGAALSESGTRHDVSERLRVAREHAVAQARHARHAAVAAPVLSRSGHGTAALGGTPWWARLASGLPLVLLALGLLVIQHIDLQEQIHAAAEIDAVLLADELPPMAYTDPGFAEFLKQPAGP
jgi:hypothetical protein